MKLFCYPKDIRVSLRNILVIFLYSFGFFCDLVGESRKLRCCRNDALGMRRALEKLNFDVHAYTNERKHVMENIINDFIDQIEAGDLVMLYFSGHGCQRRGQNFFMGVDGNGLNLHKILRKISCKDPYATVLLLDCCRGYDDTGLIRMDDSKLTNVCIGFPCAQGENANEFRRERYGLYTKNLLRYDRFHLFIGALSYV